MFIYMGKLYTEKKGKYKSFNLFPFSKFMNCTNEMGSVRDRDGNNGILRKCNLFAILLLKIP